MRVSSDEGGEGMLAWARLWTAEAHPTSTAMAASFPGAHLRAQVAVVRALADQVDHLPRDLREEGLRSQLIEELARLGCLLIEEAGSLAAARPPEDSGVFARPHSSRPREREHWREGDAQP
jgi:hypothetical protein